jgi:hypothetical protein
MQIKNIKKPSMPKNKDEKFAFGLEFQEEILRFTVTDKKEGFRALLLYEDFYFGLIEHQIIAKALKKFYSKKRKVPSEVLLKETLRQLYNHKDYVNLITEDDQKKITKLVHSLYARHAKDGDSILEEIIKFSRYVNLKDTLENINVKDFSQYDTIHKKVQKALTTGSEFQKDKGIFLVADAHARSIKRSTQEPGHATPWHQLNHLFDAGGTNKGNIIVVIGKEKRFKTACLINTTLGYMRMKKRIIYFDLENGEYALSTRAEQSLIKKEKKDILSGAFDLKLRKLFRKYQRLGVEVVIKRFPAYQATTDDLQAHIDYLYQEFGLRFEQCIIDYVGLLGAKSGKKDDTERISDAYVDVKNFAEFNNFESVWTGHHTTREGSQKREATKFASTDTAKCIDIARHMDVMVGLNQDENEKKAGVVRMEMVEQRNGPMDGNCLFWLDMANQRFTEFNKKEIDNYHHEIRKNNEQKRERDNDL